MKKINFSLMVLLLTLVACAPRVSTPIPSPIPSPVPQVSLTTTPYIPANLTPAQRAAFAALSQALGISSDKISLVSFETVIWPDGCMGVQKIGVACTKNTVPGFWILLSANGTQYEFHTNQDGTQIVPVQGMPASGTAQNTAIKQLATNLGLQVSDISVVSSASVIWSDSCMNVPLDGVACTTKNSSGYLFILQANGRLYEYHTNGSGGKPVPGTLALIWTRSNGSVAACDSLNIYASGEVYGSACKPTSSGKTNTLIKLATPAGLKQLQDWLDAYQAMALDVSNPATTPDANSAIVSGHIFGTGSQEPSADQKQSILNWAQSVYEALYKGK